MSYAHGAEPNHGSFSTCFRLIGTRQGADDVGLGLILRKGVPAANANGPVKEEEDWHPLLW